MKAIDEDNGITKKKVEKIGTDDEFVQRRKGVKLISLIYIFN